MSTLIEQPKIECRKLALSVSSRVRIDHTASGFAGRLLKALHDSGIHTFLEDDKELPKGDEITTTIVKVIEESRIVVIVFSQNYAASSFCLEVLASIVDNFDQGNHRLIIPVFYGVDPYDVRYQRGTYGRALERHEEKFKDNNQKMQEMEGLSASSS